MVRVANWLLFVEGEILAVAAFAGPPLRPTKKRPPSRTKKALNLMDGFLGLGRDEGGVVGALANGLRGNAGQSGELVEGIPSEVGIVVGRLKGGEDGLHD